MAETLKELHEELGAPSAQKLLAAAKRRGIKATAPEAREIAKGDATRQAFGGKPFKKQGHITSMSELDVMQADLIDFKQFDSSQNNNKKYILVVTSVFSRETKTDTLESKDAGEVWRAFIKLARKIGGEPSRLDTDGGQEFGGVFLENAKREGIAVQTRQAGDKNFLAITDRAIQTVKGILFREMGRTGTNKWVDKVDKASDAYNKTPNDAVQGEAPEDVRESPVAQFRIQAENAQKLRGNAKQLASRQQVLENAGAFRSMLPKQTFQRGFKPKWSNAVHKVAKIKLGQVESASGKSYQISRVLPVSSTSQPANVPKGLAAGSQARDKKQEGELSRFKKPLRQFLGNDAKGMAAIGGFLRNIPEFEKTLEKLRLNRPGGLRTAVQRMGREFQISGATGQPTIKVRPAQRLRGKQ